MSCCHYLGLLIEVSAGLINPIALECHDHVKFDIYKYSLTSSLSDWSVPCSCFFFFFKMIHPLDLLHSLISLHFISCYFPLSLWFVPSVCPLAQSAAGSGGAERGFFFKHSSVWAAGKGLDLAAARSYT